MKNILAAEVIKLKGSKLLWLIFIAGFIPAPVKYIRLLAGKDNVAADWKWFLTSQQELMIFGMIFSFIFGACFILDLERHQHTAAYVYTTLASRSGLLAAKIAVILLVVLFSHAVSIASTLIFGFLAVNRAIPADLLSLYLQASLSSVLVYAVLIGLVVLVSMIVKKYVTAVAMIIGYIILTFPFHIKFGYYICPFLIPALVSVKILGINDFLFSGYSGIEINYASFVPLLILLLAVPLAADFIYSAKKDIL